MNRIFFFFLIAIVLSVSPIEAQVGPRARPDTMIGRNPNAGTYRLFSSLGGTVIGGLAGGLAGYNVLPHAPNGDDPGLKELVYGMLAGSAVGAAVGAAAPNLRSVCNFPTRLKKTLVGASIAGAAAYLVGGGLNSDGSVIIVVPASAIGGSLASLGRCWKSYL